MASVFDHIKPARSGPPLAASEAKRLLIERYLRGDLAAPADQSVDRIARRSPNAPGRLSFAQERLWFIDQLMPRSPAFNVPMAVKLLGSVDVDALQRAVDEIVGRHESLRTTFVTIDGAPSALVADPGNSAIELVDLRSIERPAREIERHRLVEQEILQPFDLSRGPLIRTKLIQCSEQESIFIVTMHHIISDGWSLILFFRELATIYDALVAGEGYRLAPLSIQYSDYAAWQRDSLRDEIVASQLSYWRQQLSGELPVLDFPADYTRRP